MANKLEIVINTSANVNGIKQASSTLNTLEHSAVGASKVIDNAVNSVKNLTLSYFGLSALLSSSRSIIDTADSFNRLDGRLKLATDSVQEFHSQQKELLAIAKDTHNPLQNMTDLYVKLDPALERLGATTKTTNQITENFAEGLKLGGANAAESSAAILQFGQAMGSGVLRGDEFNSMMEASPKLMEYMAEGMGVPIGALRSMAENGELTAGKVSAALLKMTDEIDRDFKQLPKTVSDSVVDFKTDMGVMISEVDKATGVTSYLSDSITELSGIFNTSSGDIISTINTVREYSSVIEGLAVTYGVIAVASKSAAAVELWYATAKEKTTIATQMSTAASITNMGVTKNVTVAQIAGAEASVLMGTALKAIPFIAVASTVALLASSFFESKKQSDDLSNSLNATSESLANLTRAQLENKRQNLSLELQSSGLELRQLKQKYGEKSGRTVAQQAEIDDLEAYVKSLNDAGKNIATAQTKIRNISTIKTAPIPTKASPSRQEQIAALEASGVPTGKTAKELKAEAAAAKKLANAYKDINDQIFNISASDHDKAIKAINDYAAEKRKSGIDELTITKYVSGEKAALNRKELKDLGDDMNSARKELETKFTESDQKTTESILKRWDDGKSALVDYYTALGNSSDAFYITESDKIQKLAETGVLSNEQLVEVWDKDFAHMKDSTIKLNTVFEDAFKSMEDSMVHMFMTGKFSAEDFFNTVIEGIIRMQIRNSITEPLTQAIGGVNFGSMFSGIFGGTSAQVDASSIGSSMDWSSLGKQAWAGGLIPYYAGGAVNNFAFGGYTGDGGKYEPKGVVHGGEYVIPKWQTQRIPAVITQLESMRKRGYADGGLVGSSLSGTSAPSMPITINVENKSGTPISAENVGMNFDIKGMTVSIVVDAINRNLGGLRDSVRSVR